MNISSTSSSVVSSLAAIQGLQPQQLTTAIDTDDGSSATKPHRMHGGGHMRQAVTQALQSLGLTPPASAGAAAATSSTSPSTDGSSGSSDPGSANSGIQQDMQQFMHSLFEAVKSESSTDTSASSATGDSKTSFADGLSTLISQVSSGSVPADLQSAFSKLASDLQAAGSTMSTAASTSNSAASGVQASLQAFLTHLQQDLGYGSSATSSIGNLVATQV